MRLAVRLQSSSQRMASGVHDLRLLRALTAVAREGNVTRAAETLHVTQPALSLQLRRLSEASGLVLFRRTATGIELTPDGALLAAKAERVLQGLDDFNRQMAAMGDQLRGRLRIGTIIDPEFTRLGAFLREMVQSAPGIATELRHGMSGDVPDLLLRDQLDVGYYLGTLDDPGIGARFQLRTLSPLNYRVVAPVALAALVQGADWAALAHLPWVVTPTASAHNRLLAKIFAERGLRQKAVAQVDQEASMLAMVRSGVGLSLCRESIALNEAQSGNLVIVDGLRAETSLGLLCLAERRDEPAIRLSFDVVDRVWR